MTKQLSKTATDVQVPARLAVFLREVASLIDSHDLSTTCESDDLLQCEHSCGGLVDASQRLFAFSYYPIDGDADTTWEMLLLEDQIRQISAGQQNSIQLFACDDADCRLLHPKPDSYCWRCDNVLDFIDEFEDLRRLHSEVDDATIRSMVAIRRITHGILQLVGEDGQWPSHARRDASGIPLLSWRVELLPHIGQLELYNRIQLGEPWDSPSNRRLWTEMPALYRTHDSAESFNTNVLAVLGEGTMWPWGAKRYCRDVETGTSFTIAVMEIGNQAVNWMQPDDADFEAVLGTSRVDLARLHDGIFIVAGMVDGNPQPLSSSMTDRKLGEYLNIR